MKRLKTQFTLAACIKATGLHHKQLLNWRYRNFTCILDFEDIPDPFLWKSYLRQVKQADTLRQNLGLRLMIDDLRDFDRLVADNESVNVGTLILAIAQQRISPTMMDQARRIAKRVFVEVYTEDGVAQSLPFKPDGFVIRGNEAGGICSDMSNPAMLRKIREKTPLPIWIYGGIGPQSALAYAIGGANGVILSDCLSLLPELAEDLKEQDRKALIAGIRTQAIAIGNGLYLRISESYPELINRIKALCAAHDQARYEQGDTSDTRLSDVLAVMKHYRTTTRCFIGEEAAWASELSRRYGTLQDLMQGLEKAIRDHYTVLCKNYPLGRGNTLANELKIEFPVLQGPMTHVSDCPEFLAQVAEHGAVPFAALALSKGDKLEALMMETQKKVGGRPWGVGLLGFAPKALQEEQFAAVEKYKPDIAIVAGARPSHYQTLQRMGVIPFLHIPVASMIPSFFTEGVRHFIFEGRGCGGHIGPINSFPLWQSALIAFQQLAAEGKDVSDVRILFAGGMFDALSAAMSSVFCAPLLELGVHFGFIVGTAYLFTREILESGAITSTFQRIALDSDRTAILEARAGHAIRCAPTALAATFQREKAELLSQGMAPGHVHEKLEEISIGRLRLAAKGVKRADVSEGRETLVTVTEADQMKEGLFMVGEVAALIDHVRDMAQLHRSLCCDAVETLRGSRPRFSSHAKKSVKPAVNANPTNIAIIGMSILAPGSANLSAFWRNILAHVCCIEQVSEKRWRPGVNFHSDPDNPDTTYSTQGGFLPDVPVNCMEYGIPPGSVPHIEPAQLMTLEAVKQALIDAGYGKKEFDRKRTSVFFGMAGGGDLLMAYTVRAALKEYMHRATDIPDTVRERVIRSLNRVLPQWTEDSFPGVLGNVVAGRVANRFNLNGLNFTVDAACASSMAALQVACQDLAYGATRTAIAGGVDASQHMLGYMCFSKSKALSPTGRSKPFCSDADGIVLGEGIGVVVLKRLADAIDDGDRIYAVIKGIGGASDGKGSGMTVPRSYGQKLAIDRACEVAGLNTDAVDLIEAHGTGTPLGDRVELSTLHEILQNHGAKQPCAIGSIKSAIGHTKGASGVISVIKAALALHHKVLPAHVNADTIHPAVSSPQTRLYLNTQTRPWLRKSAQRPRRAGVSAFGFGGTNFHTILEEYGAAAHAPADLPRSLWPAELFLFAEPDTRALSNSIDAAIGFVDKMDHVDKTDASLTGLAYRHYLSQAPSTAMPVRLAVKARSPENLKEKLIQSKELMANGAVRSDMPAPRNALRLADGIWGCLRDDPAAGPLTALFPGQGAQKLHMLRELAVVFPVVRTCLEHANAVLADKFFPMEHGVLTDYLYPPNHGSPEEKKQALNALAHTPVAQPVLAAVEMALFYLLAEFNVQTGMAAGHSFGELTALWSAGVMTDRQLLTLASKRGRCMAAASKVSTGMVAVHADQNTLGGFIDAEPELTLANHNTPRQVVVSGSLEALERLEAHCRRQTWGYTRLAVSHGFHSPYMADAARQWHHELTRQHFLPPAFPVYANMTAKPYAGSDADIADMLKRHLLNSVAFVEQIETMYADGARTFVEIGPGSTLTNFVAAILKDKPHHTVAVQPRADASGIDMLLDGLAALHVCGCAVDLRPAYACRKIGTKENTNQPPSATMFLVNGGRAKPTVGVKTKKKATPSIWDDTPQSSPSPSLAASNPHPANKLPPDAAALPSGRIKGKVDSVRPIPSTHERPEPGNAAFAPAAAQPRINNNNNQEKVRHLKQVQESMRLFLETQERFQKKRLEMMERMWHVNQQLIQNMLEPAHAAPMPAFLGSGSDKAMESYPLNDRIFQDAADSPARQEQPHFENETFQASAAPLAKSTTGRDDPSDPSDPFGPSEKAVHNAVDYRSLLFDIIAERTQYPVEMLAPEQDIEADLGIDSIKRVEIITKLRTTHPSLVTIADEKYYEEMAQLRTLGDIVTWIEMTFDPPHPAPHRTNTLQQGGPRPPAAMDTSTKIDYQSLLYNIISERTQYPVEMLAPEQDIEADLGIDSIKRVEIITKLRTTHPSLATIADEKYYEEMAQLRTLGDIVTWIGMTFNPPHPVPHRTNTLQQRGPRPPAAMDTSTKIDCRSLLYNIISERTQYPVEMLAPEQDIEADLGIDSIKRVEIITKLRTTHPSLATIADEKYYEEMAQLRTLGDIVTWIDDTFGEPDTPERLSAPLAEETAAGNRKAPLRVEKVNGRQQIMDIIGEKTRYPVELIDMDLNLKDDLGMEESQLCEIMARSIDPPLRSPERQPEELRRSAQKLKTVQDLVHWMARVLESTAGKNARIDLSGAVDAPSSSLDAASIETSAEASVFRRYTLQMIEAPFPAGGQQPLSGMLILLDGGHPLGKQIQADAQKRGIRCVRVLHDGDGIAEHHDLYRFGARQEEDYKTCYHRLKASHGIARGVLNLLCLGKSSHEKCSQAVLQSFLWAKTMGADPDLRQGIRWNLFWISVTGMGGDFGLNRAMAFEATQNGLHGITKCLYHEWPGVGAKTIDVHPEEHPEQLSRFVLDECFEHTDTIKEIGFLNQKRHALTLIDHPHDRGVYQPRLNSDSVLLITGGAKGIASEAAVVLAKLYQPTLILVGRTPLPDRSPDELEAFTERAQRGENDPKGLKSQIIKEMLPSTEPVTPALVNHRYEAIINEYKIRRNIEKMRQFNAKVFYHACDCVNDHDFSELIRQTYTTFHKIDGVIHAAGCLKDALVAQKTTEHFKQVLNTKVEGARILLRELDFETLDFIIFFSSVSGRFGNRGQVDYAAANEILNKMAVKIHHQWPGKAVAVNWGPWEGDGMVSSHLKEQFIKAGIYLLPRDLGASMLDREINASHRASEVVIFGGKDMESRLPMVRHHTSPADCGQALAFVHLFKSQSRQSANSYCWELDLDQSAPYFNDHRIKEVPVLAAAVAMEIMAQAGLAAGPVCHFKGIRNFDLHKGITAAPGHSLKLRVEARVHPDGSSGDLVADVRLRLPDQVNRSNYACQVLLGKAGDDPIPQWRRFKHSRRFKHCVENLYEGRLFHTGVYRTLQSVESFEIDDLENIGIRGIIKPSTPGRVLGEGIGGLWLIDPIVFDGAYQLALLWVQERYGKMALPADIKSYQQYRSYTGGPIHCEVAITTVSAPRFLMDFIFTDEHGELYARATDVAALMINRLNNEISAPQPEPATVLS